MIENVVMVTPHVQMIGREAACVSYVRVLQILDMYVTSVTYHKVQFLMANIDGFTPLRNLTGKIDGQHLRPPVLAVLLETIEREKFD